MLSRLIRQVQSSRHRYNVVGVNARHRIQFVFGILINIWVNRFLAARNLDFKEPIYIRYQEQSMSKAAAAFNYDAFQLP